MRISRNMETPLTIGIVGGMSPESTLAYYRHIVRAHVAERGDHSYPRIVIASVSFQRYVDWQHAGAWDDIAHALDEELASLAAAGADFGIVAANTMHKVLPKLTSKLPLLHVLDAVAAEAERRGVRRLGLTGTGFTMNDGFYAAGLEARGFQVLLPETAERDAIHRMIYDDLIAGRVRPEARESFAPIARGLRRRGADAVLLACTELILVAPPAEEVPWIDTAEVHALAAWRRALREGTA
jgi:aspartate racemase